MSLKKSGKFLAIISSSPFSALPSFWLDLLLYSYRSLGFCSIFFSPFALCYSDGIISIVLSVSSLIIFSIVSILLLISLTKLYIFIVVFFRSKAPIEVFFISSVSLLKLSSSLLRLSIFFPICFKSVCNCLLIIYIYFIMAALK